MGCANKSCAFSGVCGKNDVGHASDNAIKQVAIFFMGAGASEHYLSFLRSNLNSVVQAHQAAKLYDQCFSSP